QTQQIRRSKRSEQQPKSRPKSLTPVVQDPKPLTKILTFGPLRRNLYGSCQEDRYPYSQWKINTALRPNCDQVGPPSPGREQNLRRDHGSAEMAENRVDSDQFAADIEEFLSPLLADGLAIQPPQLVEGTADCLARGVDHGRRVAVGAADRLLQDRVNHAKAK